MVSGARAVERCDRLGLPPYSDSADGLYRAYLTPAYAASQQLVARWMAQAGMAVRIDAAGNLIGRYEGTGDGPPLIVGSHLDSVRDAGRYDGPLGIMLGIECVAALHDAGERLRFPIEIYAFGDEEGSRFPLAMLTSRAVAGTLDAQLTEPADADGVTLFQAMAAYGEAVGAAVPRDFDAYRQARHPGAFAYLEAHIEQGPVLEADGLALGTVTGIAAQRRFGIKVGGRAGHAGTTAMTLRRDALAAAGYWRWGGWGLIVLAWLPVALWVARQQMERIGWYLDAHYVAVRGGWWNRWWRWAELDKVQGLRLQRSPLDRLLGTSSLQLDTAGAHGDVALTLSYLPQAQAQQVMDQLASALARRKLRW